MTVWAITLTNKPARLQTCIESVRNQTRPCNHIIGYDTPSQDWGGRYPPAVFFNETLQRLPSDDYAFWLSDDDYLLPNYVKDLAGYLDADKHVHAVYGNAQHMVELDGKFVHYRGLPSMVEVFNSHVSPSGQIDGGQFMYRVGAVRAAVGYPYAPEGIANARLSDGAFMNKVASAMGIYPVGTTVMECRTTNESAHTRPAGAGVRAHDWRSGA